VTIRVILADQAGDGDAWRQAAQEYAKRLNRYCRVILEDNAPSRYAGYLVAVNPGGQAFSSPRLAEWLQNLQNGGISDVAFFIGGEETAAEAIALSGLTLPGQVARALLLEQIYRGYKILRNEAYHK